MDIFDYVSENIEKIMLGPSCLPPLSAEIKTADGVRGSVRTLCLDSSVVDPEWAEKNWSERIQNGKGIIGISDSSGETHWLLKEDEWELVSCSPVAVADKVLFFLYENSMLSEEIHDIDDDIVVMPAY